MDPMGHRSRALAIAILLGAPAARAQAPAAAAPAEACFQAYEDAQRLRQKNQLVRARGELIRCGAGSCPAALRADCVTWLAEVERALPTLVLSARAGQHDVTAVRVSVDGEPLLERLDGSAVALDPGTHTLRFEAPGHQPVERTLVVREGEKARAVPIELTPLPEPDPDAGAEDGISTPVVLLGAVGAVGVASFTLFAIKSHSAKSDLESCKGHCPEDEVDAVRRDQLIADVSLGIGLVALGTAAYLHFGRAPERARASWSLGLSQLPGGVGIAFGSGL